MSRILELDVFAPEPDIVKWKGNDYEIVPVRVDALLRVLQAVQNLETTKGDESTAAAAKAMDSIIAFVTDHVPQLPAKELSFGELMAIINFAAQSTAEKAKGVVAEGPADQKKTEPAPQSA